MKTKIFVAHLILALTACGLANPVDNKADAQNTAVTDAFTAVAYTPIVPPTMEMPTGLPTMAMVLVSTPTPAPAQPPFIPVMTPDAYQVEHWKEFQDALAKRLIYSDYVPIALCEWDILGEASQEVYVWAVCASLGYQDMRYAVIHVAVSGAVQTVETPYNGDGWIDDIQRLFPSDIREKMTSYDVNRITQVMLGHIGWRRRHPDEPPLVVLSANPTATSAP